jgi:uncharacterized lipoprotein YbaY
MARVIGAQQGREVGAPFRQKMPFFERNVTPAVTLKLPAAFSFGDKLLN